MRVNHGGAHIGMPQQFLHRANVVAGLEKMRRKAMAKGVTTRRLQDLRLENGRTTTAMPTANQRAGQRYPRLPKFALVFKSIEQLRKMFA
jgi:hypothetical protein